MITQTQTFNSNCGEAAWLSERKENALKRFLSLKQPTRRDEAWRFANLKETDLSSFVAAPPVAHEATIIARSHGLSEFSAKLIFANNRLLHCEKNNLPEGVIFTSLEEAERDHRELFEKYFMKNLARLGSEKFRALHEAQVQAGAFLYVPAGVVLEKPIELWHWVEGEKAAVFPHTLLVCAEGSCASVIDRFCSVKEEPSLACGVNDLKVEAGARLHYVAVQEWSRQTTAFHINSTEVSQNATSTALQLNLGGRFVRAENDSRLLGEGARSVMLSINQAGADQEIDQRTLQDHIAPRATSDLLYHNALDDNARTIFAGLIKVEPDAHETDAYQKVRNLMLSDEAEANSMPGLEILADRVRCTHGATSGEINHDELFYMMARGITPNQAARLIVRGFFQVVLDRLEEPALQEELGKILDAKNE